MTYETASKSAMNQAPATFSKAACGSYGLFPSTPMALELNSVIEPLKKGTGLR
jgi:hypothetical protein